MGEAQSSRYKLMQGSSSSGYQGKSDVVKALHANPRTTCYVNPNDPDDAVLDRGMAEPGRCALSGGVCGNSRSDDRGTWCKSRRRKSAVRVSATSAAIHYRHRALAAGRCGRGRAWRWGWLVAGIEVE